MTGLRPDRHGIVADEALDPEGDRALPFWDSRLLKATTLWDAALGAGRVALGWPTTDGARIELLVPDAEPEDAAQSWLDFVRRRSSPQLVGSARGGSREDQLAESPRGRTGPRSAARRAGRAPGERDAAFVELACRVASSERDPALWLIRLVEPASALAAHGFGSREHSRRPGAGPTRASSVSSIASRPRSASIDTAIFVVGDVSYRPVHTEIAPNTALVREKLIGRDPRSKTGVRSWLALSRSHGRSAYLYAEDAQSALAARRVLDAEAERGVAPSTSFPRRISRARVRIHRPGSASRRVRATASATP